MLSRICSKTMTECDYCDEEFSNKKERLEHELESHEDDMSSHDQGQKKSELNKLQQKQQTSKHVRKKQVKYGAIGAILLAVIAGGGVLALQNSGSPGATNSSIGVGEPVHWHADYQITVCGEDQILRGGPVTAHTHGETTFHLEGVRTSKEQAQLDWIVDTLGGELEEDSIMGREDCNGEPANLTVEVNGNEIEDHLSYVPRDGDFISITYG